MATLNKIDIIGIAFDMHENIPDRFVDPCIKQAIDIDFHAIVPKSLIDAIKSLNTVDNSTPELTAFYEDYLKPVWAYFAYARFLQFHGNNVTAFGLVEQIDTNTQAVDTRTRSYLVANVKNDAAVYVTRMRNELKRVSYTFDGNSYVAATNEVIVKQSNFQIRAIG